MGLEEHESADSSKIFAMGCYSELGFHHTNALTWNRLLIAGATWNE